MRFLKDGRDYFRDEERGGWKWSHDSDDYAPCDAETCAMLDLIMDLYEEIGKTPEERAAEAKEPPHA